MPTDRRIILNAHCGSWRGKGNQGRRVGHLVSSDVAQKARNNFVSENDIVGPLLNSFE